MKKKKIVEEFVPDFIQIPYQLIVDPDLTSVERVLYGVISFYAKMKDKKCFASNRTLGDMILTTSNNVSKSLKNLQDKKYILVTYSDPDTKKKRTEIIPLVDPQNGSKNSAKVIPTAHTPRKGGLFPQRTRVIPTAHTGMRYNAYPENADSVTTQEKETVTEQVISQDHTLSRVCATTQQSSNSKNNDGEYLSNSLREAPAEPSLLAYKPGEKFVDQVRGISRYGSMEEIPHKLVCDVITFFLPVFPDVFISKNPFVLKTNHTAVKGLLMRLTPEEIKDVIDKYHSMVTDKFRPETASIYDFCFYKFPKIEAYVKKSAGSLWAQRSISTPEQSKVRDAQYSAVIEAGREKTRLAKEKWDREHPKTI